LITLIKKNLNMKPITFEESNFTFAENQPEYLSLPVHHFHNKEGEVVFCMKLSFWETLRLVFTQKLWCSILTFNAPLQPTYFSTKKSDVMVIEK